MACWPRTMLQLRASKRWSFLLLGNLVKLHRLLQLFLSLMSFACEIIAGTRTAAATGSDMIFWRVSPWLLELLSRMMLT